MIESKLRKYSDALQKASEEIIPFTESQMILIEKYMTAYAINAVSAFKSVLSQHSRV